MTREQRDILKVLLDQEGAEYNLITIEYPSYSANGQGLETCLKTVSRMVESDECFVDYYNEQGATIETRSYFAHS